MAIRRTRSGLNLNMEAVQDSFNKVSALTTVEEGQSYSKAIQQQLNYLNQIKRQVEKQEKAFYSAIKVSGLDELQQKITKLNDSGLKLLSSSGSGSIVKELMEYGIKGTNEAYLEAVRENLNEIATSEEFQKLLVEGYNQEIMGLTENKMIEFFKTQDNKFLTVEEVKSLRKKLKQSSNKNYGLFSTLQIKYNPEQQESISKPNFEFSNELSHYIVKKLYDITNKKLGKELKKTEPLKNNKQMIIETIKGIVLDKITDETIKNLVEQEMTTYAGTYDVNISTSSIIGYLGEVQLNVIWKYLFNNSSTLVTNTGNLKSLVGNKEIGIDTVVKIAGNQFNFQVKNYSMFDKMLHFDEKNKYSASMDALFDRIQVGNNPLGSLIDTIKQLYSTVQFNQEFSDLPEDSSYKPLYENLNELANNYIDDFAKANLDRIARIDQYFSVANAEIFNVKDIYLNTFFMVGGQYLVPSSFLLKEIIDSFSKQANKNLLKFDKVNLMFNPNGPKLENYRTKKIGTSGLNLTQKDVLKSVKVEISYAFNLEKIINNALNNVKNIHH